MRVYTCILLLDVKHIVLAEYNTSLQTKLKNPFICKKLTLRSGQNTIITYGTHMQSKIKYSA